jgi:hypothetical protein
VAGSNLRTGSAPKIPAAAKPGPGHYNVPDAQATGPGYKQNRSSMFASGVKRAINAAD